MTTPGSPDPGLPAADWFADPEYPGQLRYWDGSQWTDHRAPDPAAASGQRWQSGVLPDPGLRPVGELVNDGFRGLLARIKHLLLIWLVAEVAVVATSAVFVVLALRDLRATGLGSGGADFDVSGFGFSHGVLLLLGALVWIIGWWISELAFRHQMYSHHAGAPVDWSASLVRGARRLPVLLIWFLAAVIAIAALVAVIWVGFAAAPILGTLALLAAIPLAIWLAVRLAFVFDAVAVTNESPLQVSWRRTAGVFWPVLGRLIVIAVIAALVRVGFQIVESIASGVLLSGVDVEVDETANQVLLDGEVVTELAFADLFGSATFVVVTLMMWFLLTSVGMAVARSVSVTMTTLMYRDLEETTRQ